MRPANRPLPAPSWTKLSKSPYALLKEKSSTLQEGNRTDGWSYVISGGIAIGICIPAYYLSKDLFARVIYSVGQTVGIAGIGYGSYLLLIDDDYTRFLKVMDRVPSLTESQKNEMAWSFLSQNAERARRARKIRLITHTLTAGLNFSNALTADQSELKTALYFLAGINALAAINFLFGTSEEEKLIAAGFGADISGRAVASLQVRF